MKAMPKLIGWCDEAAVGHWRQDTTGLPRANEALERMQSTGHLSKVRHPSAAHAARETAPTPAGRARKIIALVTMLARGETIVPEKPH